MKKIVLMAVLAVLAIGAWGQSNAVLDAFLDESRPEADVATSLLLVAQAAGELPEDATADDGFAWGLDASFGKHVAKLAPEDPVSLGLFYLALLKTFDIRGGLMFAAAGTPRYAAMEAAFRGYVEPSSLYYTRSMPPYEVLTGITYVLEDVEGGRM